MLPSHCQTVRVISTYFEYNFAGGRPNPGKLSRLAYYRGWSNGRMLSPQRKRFTASSPQFTPRLTAALWPPDLPPSPILSLANSKQFKGRKIEHDQKPCYLASNFFRISDFGFFRASRFRTSDFCQHAIDLPRMKNKTAARRTYSPSKVIHRWRGVTPLHTPQPTVNNFGGGAKMLGQQHIIELNPRVEHAGSGRRIHGSNVTTFCKRHSRRDPAPCRQGTLRTLRLQASRQAETNIL